MIALAVPKVNMCEYNVIALAVPKPIMCEENVIALAVPKPIMCEENVVQMRAGDISLAAASYARRNQDTMQTCV